MPMAKTLLYGYSLHRLLLYGIHGHGSIGNLCEIDVLQVDAAYGAVVHGAEIYGAARRVGCRSPLRSAGDVYRNFAIGKFDTYRDVEIIQNLEALQDGLFSCGLAWRGGLVEGGAYKT